jgi:hypothetical protein
MKAEERELSGSNCGMHRRVLPPPHPQPFSPMAGRLESSLHNEFVLRPAKGEKGAKKAVVVIAFMSRRSPLIGARHMPILAPLRGERALEIENSLPLAPLRGEGDGG